MENDINVTNKSGISLTRKIAIIFIVLVIISLVASVIYVNFIKKDEKNPNDRTDNNTIVDGNDQQNEKDMIIMSLGEQYTITSKMTFKSKDNNNILILTHDSKALSEAIKIAPTYGYDKEWSFAYYNDKLISVDEILSYGKYLVVSSNEIVANYDRSGYDYYFIVNNETKELLSLDPKIGHNIRKLNEKYYIYNHNCNYNDYAVYDENLNKVGTHFIWYDNFHYYILDKNIVKYDASGKIVARSKNTFEPLNNNDSSVLHYESQDYDGILYIVINNQKDIYFVDTSSLNAIKLGTVDEYNYGGNDFQYIDIVDGNISISLNNKNNQKIIFMYDLEKKEIVK